MFDTMDAELADWLADVPEPDWAEHPLYSGMVSDSERLQRLLALAPAARPTGELALLDPAGLSAGERIDLVAALQEQQNWLQAVQARVLAQIEAADTSRLGLGQEAVSLALKVPPRTAQRLLKTARTLVDELPRTLALLAGGDISERHVQLITETVWRLDPALVGEFEDRVLGRAADQTLGQLRQSASRAALAVDPATGQQRHARAVADRRVGFTPAEDGMVELPVLVDAADGQLIFTRLTAAATRLLAADARTMDQRRADLLVDAVLTGLPEQGLPELQGRRPSIQVVVAADTLLGLDDQPAHLDGYGPVTAQTARRLAADQSGTWRRLLTDPDTGQLLDISAERYRPSQRLRDYVSARDSVCAFPTCTQPGYRCEYEHTTPYQQGGRTNRANAALACRRHNLCKINTDWDYHRNHDGTLTWTTDTGHHYTSHPPQRWNNPHDNEPHDTGSPHARPDRTRGHHARPGSTIPGSTRPRWTSPGSTIPGSTIPGPTRSGSTSPSPVTAYSATATADPRPATATADPRPATAPATPARTARSVVSDAVAGLAAGAPSPGPGERPVPCSSYPDEPPF